MAETAAKHVRDLKTQLNEQHEIRENALKVLPCVCFGLGLSVPRVPGGCLRRVFYTLVLGVKVVGGIFALGNVGKDPRRAREKERDSRAHGRREEMRHMKCARSVESFQLILCPLLPASSLSAGRPRV
jgi:hypothetical protein